MLKPSLNWLLIFVPISIVAEFALHQPVLIFVTACVSIVPLAGLIGRATEALAIRSGPRLGGLLNATFGNVTELIIAVLLVLAGEFQVVKASLVGSIVGNLVLVLGASYFAGGLRIKEQTFEERSARLHCASLLLAVAGLLMPAVFVFAEPRSTGFERSVVSIAVAAILMLVYFAALVFTFITHDHVFAAPHADEQPRWSVPAAMSVLLGSSIVVGLEAEFLVGSLEPTVEALGVSRLFIGMFVVAIIGNAAEHASAVWFALEDKMDVAIEISFGSATQIALLVSPLLVFISLAVARPMDFVFSGFEVVAVGLATIVVSVISLDGRSNWLEGLQLLCVYMILAVSVFFIG